MNFYNNNINHINRILDIYCLRKGSLPRCLKFGKNTLFYLSKFNQGEEYYFTTDSDEIWDDNDKQITFFMRVYPERNIIRISTEYVNIYTGFHLPDLTQHYKSKYYYSEEEYFQESLTNLNLLPYEWYQDLHKKIIYLRGEIEPLWLKDV